jgi:hypothetical protein
MPKQIDSIQKKDRSVKNDNIFFFLKKTTSPEITNCTATRYDGVTGSVAVPRDTMAAHGLLGAPHLPFRLPPSLPSLNFDVDTVTSNVWTLLNVD